ncbi:TPA: diacylglycerol kinase family protein [Candidatus Galligastranaerophilus intestinigallinarum]|nr:diacylglycerol kinase family protein [Candidatus Galligastranaerophilus intestinigallinarum]
MKKYQSKSFIKSAMHATNGLYLAFRTQKNFRKHIVIAVFVLTLAFLLKAKGMEIAIIVATNTCVLVAELVNSVIEFVMDAYYKNKYSRLCKFAKDISAGAVLLCAISSAAIAAILLVPRLINFIKPFV